MTDLIAALSTRLAEWMAEAEAEVVTDPARLGWDQRAGWGPTISVTRDAIIAQGGGINVMEYYSGLSYVDAEHVTRVGEYTVYHDTCARVLGHLDIYWDRDPVD